ncbi:DeoR/GlpR transcriptional regulator [Mesorhizobium sp. WSM4307]|nr:DeoR/GlpR transcriptional regulator [Mesorhizobium sp. WSM4315]TRC86719.1 DeoR/GlpR transcriptional regulator [Mesorhizobium sp. WSM4307]
MAVHGGHGVQVIGQGQAVVSAALAVEFDISEDAIRRDLRAIAAAGRCRRVYGGALPLLASSVPMSVRMDTQHRQKQALAQTAATMIEPGEFIFLDSGSTNLALIDFLPKGYDLTLATNSIDIAGAALRRQDLNLIMLGGTVDLAVGGCVDATAIGSLAQMNIDRSFIGVCSVSPTFGLSAFAIADATFKRALVATRGYTIALATTDKLEVRAPHRVSEISEIDCLVLQHDAPISHLDDLVRAGASIVKALQPF